MQLLRKERNVNAMSNRAMQGIRSWTAMQRAAAYWSVPMMELFKSYGADVNFYNKDDFSSAPPLLLAAAPGWDNKYPFRDTAQDEKLATIKCKVYAEGCGVLDEYNNAIGAV